jgi:hypothetical protein
MLEMQLATHVPVVQGSTHCAAMEQQLEVAHTAAWQLVYACAQFVLTHVWHADVVGENV